MWNPLRTRPNEQWPSGRQAVILRGWGFLLGVGGRAGYIAGAIPGHVTMPNNLSGVIFVVGLISFSAVLFLIVVAIRNVFAGD